MPMGTHHRIEGMLRWTDHGFALIGDGGSYWTLGVPWRFKKLARRHLDQRMFVAGTRCGFNDLIVTQMEVAGKNYCPTGAL